jgi:hypothetical protein
LLGTMVRREVMKEGKYNFRFKSKRTNHKRVLRI